MDVAFTAICARISVLVSFMPLITITLSGLPPEKKMASASSSLNFLRTLDVHQAHHHDIYVV